MTAITTGLNRLEALGHKYDRTACPSCGESVRVSLDDANAPDDALLFAFECGHVAEQVGTYADSRFIAVDAPEVWVEAEHRWTRRNAERAHLDA